MRSLLVVRAALLATALSGWGAGFANAEESAATDAAVRSGDPSAVVGAPRGRPLSGAVLVARTNEVGDLLRCPVCQGLSVTDSPATMAVNMKAQVKEMLAAGYAEDQILSYFERSYGEFVRLQPPLRGVIWLVWLAPLLALAVGAVVVMRFLRSPAGAAGVAQAASTVDPRDAQAPGPDTLPDDRSLARQVLRVRELAYGWPDGRSPALTRDRKPGRAAGTAEPRS